MSWFTELQFHGQRAYAGITSLPATGSVFFLMLLDCVGEEAFFVFSLFCLAFKIISWIITRDTYLSFKHNQDHMIW